MLTRGAVLLAAVALLVSGPVTSAVGGPPPHRDTGGTAALAPGDGAPGIGDPYFPLDGNGGIDVSSYDVHDAYDFSHRTLSGWTTLTLRTTESLTSFDLDFLLPVAAVHLSTGGSTFSRPSRHELRIQPAQPIAAGTTVRVRVAYAGHPGRQSWGGESNWVATGTEAMALNEPHMAPWWFPSNDHPLDKASMDLHITVPATKQVVAGGRLVGVRRAAGHATYHWVAAPMATYLAFFVAGRFDDPARHVPRSALLPRGLPRPAARLAEAGDAGPPAHRGHRALAERPPRPVPVRAGPGAWSPRSTPGSPWRPRPARRTRSA